MLRFPLLFLALVSTAFAQGPQFQPKRGSRWSHTHDLELNLKFDHISMRVNGQTNDSSDFDVEWNSTHHMWVEEAVGEWQPSGLRQLERTYLEVQRDRNAPVKTTIDGTTATAEVHAHGEAPIQGERVQFESSEPGKVWTPTIVQDAPSETKPSWLAGLTADLDYSMLLPGNGVKAGAHWSVDPRSFLLALDAGSELPYDYESGANDHMPYWLGRVSEQPELSELWDDFEDCRVECQLMPERQLGHLRLMEIQVTARFNGETDLSDRTAQNGIQPGSKTARKAGTASQSTFLSGSGVYRWNLDSRTMHSFQFRATGKFSREQAFETMVGDDSMQIELSAEGPVRLDVQAKSQR